MSTLPNYYFTFVDVMEFKDVTNEVITSLATTQFHLDIVSLTCAVSHVQYMKLFFYIDIKF